MKRRLYFQAAVATTFAAGLAGLLGLTNSVAGASTPTGGTLSPLSGPVTWNGFPGPGASPEGS